MSNLHRSKSWRNLLNDMMAQEGVDLAYVAEYIGSPYNGSETVFYAKLPRKRTRFIGIGMALHQSLETINHWISEFSVSRILYAKDVAEDLIWIYLIGLNQQNRDSGRNYYQMFEECQEAALMTYRQLWDEITLGSLSTADLEIELQKIRYDDTFQGLKEFIVDHMDSFKTAYSRPRRMLDRYVECILTEGQTLNSLRGFLDDSMINFLSGDSETIHTMDRRQPVRMVSFKPVPKNRKTHISLCLALGMTREEVDEYLGLMGYAPLKSDGDEGTLAKMLSDWEERKPLQRVYKDACFHDAPCTIGAEEQRRAVQEMLSLRRDLQMEYHKQGIIFPYG